MKVFIEPDCSTCERILKIVNEMHDTGLICELIIINRTNNPELCRDYGILVYPAVYIEDKLIFYGEFNIDDALKYAKYSPDR